MRQRGRSCSRSRVRSAGVAGSGSRVCVGTRSASCRENQRLRARDRVQSVLPQVLWPVDDWLLPAAQAVQQHTLNKADMQSRKHRCKCSSQCSQRCNQKGKLAKTQTHQERGREKRPHSSTWMLRRSGTGQSSKPKRSFLCWKCSSVLFRETIGISFKIKQFPDRSSKEQSLQERQSQQPKTK